jgi:hypothetical protein
MPTASKPKTTRAKKEKKPIQVVAVVTPSGIEGTFTPEPRKPLIVHLPFQSSEVEFNTNVDIRYDPNPPGQPEPYEDESFMYFEVNQEGGNETTQVGVEVDGWKMAPTPAAIRAQLDANHPVEEKPTELFSEIQITQQPVIEQKKEVVPIPKTATLLACYASKPNETIQLPTSTDMRCFHCTHNFDTPPFFLPKKLVNGVFHVYGNFSHPECALAYLLEEKLDSHVRWEQMALLHCMYKSHGRIHPAPPRSSLKIFGGPYSYEQFSQIIAEKKVRIDVQQPPMVSILATLDQKPIDFYDNVTQTSFTGFSADRFKAWSEQGGALRLRRSKPLKDKESTLDSILSISRPGDVAVTF